MINSISNAHTSNVEPSSQSSAKPASAAQKPQKTSTPQDTVTIKSGGDADHDGDSK